MSLFSQPPLKASFSEVRAIMPRQMYDLGRLPNASLRYSASAPPRKCPSLSPSAWLATQKSRQLSRRWVGRKPSTATETLAASSAVCKADEVFPDSSTHFAPVKHSTDAAAAGAPLNELHSGKGAKQRASLHSIYEGRCRSNCRRYCFGAGGGRHYVW